MMRMPDLDERHAQPLRPSSIGMAIIADHHAIGCGHAQPSKGLGEEMRLRLADDHAILWLNACQQSLQKASCLRDDGGTVSGVRQIRIRHDQSRAVCDGIDRRYELRVGEIGVARQ